MTDDKKKRSDAETTGAGDVAVMPVISGEFTLPHQPPPTVTLPEETDEVLPSIVMDIGSLTRNNASTLFGNGATVEAGITDKVLANPDASESDVLRVLASANGLPAGEATVVATMLTQLAGAEEHEARRVQTWVYENVHSGRTIKLRIGWDKAMRPSESTGLLVTHMRITQGESVLDLGTGTGVIAIAAHKLGATSVVASDLHRKFADEISVNLRMNGLSTSERATVRMLFGDMFAPVSGEMFDHVIMNPPSIPCCAGQHLDIHYDSGVEGRDIIDRLLREVPTVLKPGGRLTMVHGSLSDMPLTLEMLRDLGFTGIEVSEPQESPFKDFYPTEYLQSLKAQGKAEFREEQRPDGSLAYFETRRVITAKCPEKIE